MNHFETIDPTTLDEINGGNRGRAIWNGVKAGAGWAWRNVVAPAGGGALYSWAADKLGGGQQQPPPAQQPPAQ